MKAGEILVETCQDDCQGGGQVLGDLGACGDQLVGGKGGGAIHVEQTRAAEKIIIVRIIRPDLGTSVEEDLCFLVIILKESW